MKIKKKIVAIVLSFIFGVIGGIFTAETNYFGLMDSQEMLTVSPSWGNGITIKASADEVATTASTSARRLTATITPADSTEKVDWSMTWASTGSKLSDYGEVTEYVSLTPTADGALTADVECLQALPGQIIVTVSVRLDTSISASCTLDYYKRFEGVSVLMKGEVITATNGDIIRAGFADESEGLSSEAWNTSDFNFFQDVYYGVGSVDNNFTGLNASSCTVEYTDYFKETLQEYLPDYTWTFGSISYSGTLTKTYSQLEILTTLATASVPIENYIDSLMSLFLAEGSEIEVTLPFIAFQYDSPTSVTYYIDVEVA